MAVHHETFEIETGMLPAFVDVTDRVKEITAASGITDGILLVYSQHTTCSVFIQEDAHDETYFGIKYLHQDMLDGLEKIFPQCRKEGQYMHPGPKCLAYCWEHYQEPPAWTLNTDAHLRSALLGRSQSIPLIQGHPELGEHGRIYFVDFDVTRPRSRTVRLQIVGDRSG